MSVVKELLDKLPDRPLKFKKMTVVVDSPLTVALEGGTSAVPAISLTGEAFAPGTEGYAFWSPPIPPVVFAGAGSSDTGWVNLTYQGGFDSSNGGQAAYRRIGSQVFLKGGANKGTDFTTTAETVAVLPSGARPGQTERFASYGAGGRIGRVEIETNGNINVAVPNILNSPDEPFIWMGLSHTFLT